MAISVGDTLPDGTFLKIGEKGPEEVSLASLSAGKTLAIFGLPGAYTGTCTTAHVPSFIRNMDALKSKGIDEVICVAVNDPFVMQTWGAETGAAEAGIHMLGDSSGAYTAAIGMGFDAPPVGFYGRSKRYAMVATDGKVTYMNTDDNPGECNLSAAETMLDAL
ncbi:MAG: peroxiredoxin [Pseudomonadota bacterium]